MHPYCVCIVVVRGGGAGVQKKREIGFQNAWWGIFKFGF